MAQESKRDVGRSAIWRRILNRSWYVVFKPQLTHTRTHTRTHIGTRNEAGVAANMYTFFSNFYKEFPEYLEKPLYLFGESYAGHYVPAIAHKIWSENKNDANTKIPLAGLAIGNGLTDPSVQYKYYAEMGHTGGRAEGGHAPSGVLSEGDYIIMKGLLPACELGIAQCNKGQSGAINTTACLAAYDVCNLMSEMPIELSGLNPYVRFWSRSYLFIFVLSFPLLLFSVTHSLNSPIQLRLENQV